MFKKAVKLDAKLRLAVCGPAGSGKTYTLLQVATELGGPIAYVDTEHGSASKYADLFSFDVIEPATFDPRDLIDTIHAAIEGGYRIICIDSLSHYWMGKGGELEMVDAAAKRTQGNSFAAWKHVTPVHNQLVDTIISAPIHVLVAMRTKTEWVIEKDERTGKSAPRKVGTQPVMRDGIEFEFDVCGDLDQDNTLTVTKSRCPDLSGKAINRPGREMAQTLRKWLAGATPAHAPVYKGPIPASVAAAVSSVPAAAEPVPPVAIGYPDEVQAIFARIVKPFKDTIPVVIADLRFELAEIVGMEKSGNFLASLIEKHGQPLSRVSVAREIALGMWMEIQDARKEAAPVQAELIPQEVPYGAD